MVLRTAFPGSFCSKKLSALPVDTHPERRGLFECTDSPQKADFVGMCTSLPCQKKKPVVTQARLELATLRIQVMRTTIAQSPLHIFLWAAQIQTLTFRLQCLRLVEELDRRRHSTPIRGVHRCAVGWRGGHATSNTHVHRHRNIGVF